MDTIDVRGAQLSGLSLGVDGDTTPVVMLHGLINGSLATWYSAFAAPLAQQRRVLLYDLRGHGSSSLPADGFDLETQADDLTAVLTHYDADRRPIDVVGHSMGALIALHFALRAPQRVRRLVLVDAPMAARENVDAELRAITTPEALTAYIDARMPGSTGRRRERLLSRLSALFFESTLLRDLLSMDAEPEAALRSIQVPTLLVYGRTSNCLAAGQQLAQLLPQTELHLLDCGHYIPEEAPAALRDCLSHFLDAPTAVRKEVTA